jgi:CHAT domain-containing protein
LDLSEDSEITKKISNEFDGLMGEEHLPSERCCHVPNSRGQSLEYNEEKGTNNALESLFRKLLYKVSIHQEEIVIIPDGNLYKVPFAALQDPDTGLYLSETKRIRLAPAITTLKLLQEFPADYHCKKGALIVGDPLVGKVMLNGKETDVTSLENAFCEALAIGSILYVTPLTKEEATKQAVIERLKQGVSVIHIAAHGDESKATIALAPSPETRAKKIPDEEDYMLTMADVQKAQVRAQLVVLSCCHSGRGEIRAEGVVGMCRAFLASGARAVVASLWAIDDEATYDFMTKFYLHLREGKSASTSLQQTMKEMRNISNYNKPKYWAPFFLMGDDVTHETRMSGKVKHML